MLRQNWKRPLHCAQFARDMSQYCVFCRQWISVPRRNLVVLGGALNATVAPIPGLVGKGVLASRSRKPEEELQSCLEASSLCLLNTWGSGRACKCGTFRNGEAVLQIDFLATRRPAADRVARTAGPRALDLTPAREGPKHWPVKASVPLVAGWMLKPVRPAVVAPPRYSRAQLAASLDQDTAHARAFRSEVQQLVQSAVCTQPLHSLNAALIPVCARYFPEQRRTRHRPGDAPVVVQCIRHMWRMHAQLRVRSGGEMRRRVFAAWFRYFRFRQASKAVRREGKAARRRWVEAQIEEADLAADRGDMRAVFRVVQSLAPKKRRDAVRIRGPQGQLLDQREQFQAIFAHFRAVFSRKEDFRHVSAFLDPEFSLSEVADAICKMRNQKRLS